MLKVKYNSLIHVDSDFVFQNRYLGFETYLICNMDRTLIFLRFINFVVPRSTVADWITGDLY